jgi:chromate reductase
MAKLKVFVLVGGICKDSLNQQLLGFVKQYAGDKMEFDQADIAALPYFSQDLENNPPQVVKDFQARAAKSDAVLILTPEYNRSFPGVLKNAIDWGSRPHGTNVWAGKPGGIMGAATGIIGTFGAQNQLRQVLSFLGMAVMPAPQFYFSSTGNITDGKLSEASVGFLTSFLTAYEAWIHKFK